MESVKNLRFLAIKYADKRLLNSFFSTAIKKHSESPGSILKKMNCVYSDDLSTVSYKFLDSFVEQNFASTQNQNCVIAIQSSASLSIFQYELIGNNRINTTPISSHTYSCGEQIELLKGSIYKIIVHEPGFVILANDNDSSITRSTFCTQSGSLVSTSATNNQHSKLQFAAKLLGLFKNQKSKTVLKKLLNHPVYFVRWQAAQSFSLLAEKEEILNLLHIMKNDENEMISKAAQSSLQRISK